jgi:hypothetical protein
MVLKPILSANGTTGQIELYEDRVVIRRAGLRAVIAQGLKGDKEIQLGEITAVQLRLPRLGHGYIEFSFRGGRESKGGLYQARYDENTVTFGPRQSAAFEALKAAVDDRLKSLRVAEPAGAAISVADELSKLAKLRDEGILTDEEFQAQKRSLLS